MDKDILVFYGMLAFAIILTRIPYVGKFFRVTGTLFHEAGHVWVALLLGHRVKSVSLSEDLSGEAITAGSKGWGRFFIAFGVILLPVCRPGLFFICSTMESSTSC